MKNDVLIDAIGLINEETVKDAKATQKKAVVSPLKKAVALVAALVLCITASVPALTAAGVEPAYQLLYAVSPSTAQMLKPVRRSCVDNGIQMEVVSAYVHDDTAKIYVAMKDLEGDRIDETTDLFDSYDINTPYDSSGNCRFESYNEETGVATFLITVTQMDNVNIRGNKITFSVSEFLSHKNNFEGIISEFDLSAVSKNPDTKHDVDIRGGSFSYDTSTEVLVSSGDICQPVDGINITAAGYIDGKLHIQLCYGDILKTDNHGWIWLENAAGDTIECDGFAAFWGDEHTASYQEYIFNIPYEELSDYDLYGDFVTCNTLTEGNWAVTFPLNDVK